MNCTQILNDRGKIECSKSVINKQKSVSAATAKTMEAGFPIPCSTLAEEAFGSRRRAAMMMLGSSRLLVGRK